MHHSASQSKIMVDIILFTKSGKFSICLGPNKKFCICQNEGLVKQQQKVPFFFVRSATQNTPIFHEYNLFIGHTQMYLLISSSQWICFMMFFNAISLNLFTGQQFSIGSTTLLRQVHTRFCAVVRGQIRSTCMYKKEITENQAVEIV